MSMRCPAGYSFGTTLPQDLGWVMTLRSLQLSNNALEGSLPDAWSRLTALTQLNLQVCELVFMLMLSR